MSRTRAQAILTRIHAQDHADQLHRDLLEAVSAYGLAAMDLATFAPGTYVERSKASRDAFGEVLRLASELRDLAVPTTTTTKGA